VHYRFPFRNRGRSLNVACAPFEQIEDTCNGTADIFILVIRKTRFGMRMLELLRKVREMCYRLSNTLSINSIFEEN